MTDGTGTTTYAHDDAGDVTSQSLVAASGSGLSDVTVKYGYVTQGQIGSITYPGFRTHPAPKATYTYNTHGEMASVKDWATHVITFSYDRNGNMTAQDNPGNDNTFSYNADNQVTQVIDTLSGSTSAIAPQVVAGGSLQPAGETRLTPVSPSTTSPSATSGSQGTSTVTLNTMKSYFDPVGSGSITQDGVPASGEAKPAGTPALPAPNATPTSTTRSGIADALVTPTPLTSEHQDLALLPPVSTGAPRGITLDSTVSCSSKYQLVSDFAPGSTLPVQNANGSAPAAGSRNTTGQITQFDQNLYSSCDYTGSSLSSERNYAYDAAGHVIYQGTSAYNGTQCQDQSTPVLGCFAYAPGGNPTEVSNT